MSLTSGLGTRATRVALHPKARGRGSVTDGGLTAPAATCEGRLRAWRVGRAVPHRQVSRRAVTGSRARAGWEPGTNRPNPPSLSLPTLGPNGPIPSRFSRHCPSVPPEGSTQGTVKPVTF